MATTLSPSNLVKPATGDPGATFWPALEAVIQALNDHRHTGADSYRLDSKSSTAILDTASITGAGSWTSLGSGNYSKVITTPSGLEVNDVAIKFRGAAAPYDGDYLELSITKASSTTYTAYTNTPIAMTIIYT